MNKKSLDAIVQSIRARIRKDAHPIWQIQKSDKGIFIDRKVPETIERQEVYDEQTDGRDIQVEAGWLDVLKKMWNEDREEARLKKWRKDKLKDEKKVPLEQTIEELKKQNPQHNQDKQKDEGRVDWVSGQPKVKPADPAQAAPPPQAAPQQPSATPPPAPTAAPQQPPAPSAGAVERPDEYDNWLRALATFEVGKPLNKGQLGAAGIKLHINEGKPVAMDKVWAKLVSDGWIKLEATDPNLATLNKVPQEADVKAAEKPFEEPKPKIVSDEVMKFALAGLAKFMKTYPSKKHLTLKNIYAFCTPDEADGTISQTRAERIRQQLQLNGYIADTPSRNASGTQIGCRILKDAKGNPVSEDGKVNDAPRVDMKDPANIADSMAPPDITPEFEAQLKTYIPQPIDVTKVMATYIQKHSLAEARTSTEEIAKELQQTAGPQLKILIQQGLHKYAAREKEFKRLIKKCRDSKNFLGMDFKKLPGMKGRASPVYQKAWEELTSFLLNLQFMDQNMINACHAMAQQHIRNSNVPVARIDPAKVPPPAPGVGGKPVPGETDEDNVDAGDTSGVTKAKGTEKTSSLNVVAMLRAITAGFIEDLDADTRKVLDYLLMVRGKIDWTADGESINKSILAALSKNPLGKKLIPAFEKMLGDGYDGEFIAGFLDQYKEERSSLPKPQPTIPPPGKKSEDFIGGERPRAPAVTNKQKRVERQIRRRMPDTTVAFKPENVSVFTGFRPKLKRALQHTNKMFKDLLALAQAELSEEEYAKINSKPVVNELNKAEAQAKYEAWLRKCGNWQVKGLFALIYKVVPDPRYKEVLEQGIEQDRHNRPYLIYTDPYSGDLVRVYACENGNIAVEDSDIRQGEDVREEREPLSLKKLEEIDTEVTGITPKQKKAIDAAYTNFIFNPNSDSNPVFKSNVDRLKTIAFMLADEKMIGFKLTIPQQRTLLQEYAAKPNIPTLDMSVVKPEEHKVIAPDVVSMAPAAEDVVKSLQRAEEKEDSYTDTFDMIFDKEQKDSFDEIQNQLYDNFEAENKQKLIGKSDEEKWELFSQTVNTDMIVEQVRPELRPEQLLLYKKYKLGLADENTQKKLNPPIPEVSLTKEQQAEIAKLTMNQIPRYMRGNQYIQKLRDILTNKPLSTPLTPAQIDSYVSMAEKQLKDDKPRTYVYDGPEDNDAPVEETVKGAPKDLDKDGDNTPSINLDQGEAFQDQGEAFQDEDSEFENRGYYDVYKMEDKLSTQEYNEDDEGHDRHSSIVNMAGPGDDEPPDDDDDLYNELTKEEPDDVFLAQPPPEYTGPTVLDLETAAEQYATTPPQYSDTDQLIKNQEAEAEQNIINDLRENSKSIKVDTGGPYTQTLRLEPTPIYAPRYPKDFDPSDTYEGIYKPVYMPDGFWMSYSPEGGFGSDSLDKPYEYGEPLRHRIVPGAKNARALNATVAPAVQSNKRPRVFAGMGVRSGWVEQMRSRDLDDPNEVTKRSVGYVVGVSNEKEIGHRVYRVPTADSRYQNNPDDDKILEVWFPDFARDNNNKPWSVTLFMPAKCLQVDSMYRVYPGEGKPSDKDGGRFEVPVNGEVQVVDPGDTIKCVYFLPNGKKHPYTLHIQSAHHPTKEEVRLGMPVKVKYIDSDDSYDSDGYIVDYATNHGAEEKYQLLKVYMPSRNTAVWMSPNDLMEHPEPEFMPKIAMESMSTPSGNVAMPSTSAPDAGGQAQAEIGDTVQVPAGIDSGPATGMVTNKDQTGLVIATDSGTGGPMEPKKIQNTDNIQVVKPAIKNTAFVHMLGEVDVAYLAVA